MYLNQFFLILHFLGLAMGLSTGFANMVMMGILAKAAPGERPVLMRFPPMMARVGSIGLGLLWITGLSMLFTKWGGFANFGNMPWQFKLKLTLVIILSGLVGYMQVLERRMRKGDNSALAMMRKLGALTFLLAISIIVFAVLAFT